MYKITKITSGLYLYSAPVGGPKLLTEVFHLCFPLNSSEADDLLSWLEDTWFNLAMGEM